MEHFISHFMALHEYILYYMVLFEYILYYMVLYECNFELQIKTPLKFSIHFSHKVL